jgi:hypothetical protein
MTGTGDLIDSGRNMETFSYGYFGLLQTSSNVLYRPFAPKPLLIGFVKTPEES